MRLGKVKQFFVFGVCALVVFGMVEVFPSITPGLVSFFEKTAAAAVMLQLPEGSIQYIKDRFSDDELQDEPGIQDPAEPASRPESSPSSAPEDIPAESSSPSGENGPQSPPIETIPEGNRGTISELTFGPDQSGLYIPYQSGFIKNSTHLDNDAVLSILDGTLPFAIEAGDQPQVLIVHTHATESYEPYDRTFCDTSNTWRSTDNSQNVVYLGDIITNELRAAGISVIHDSTQHDYPSYNGSYDRSAETVKKWLNQYPSIKVVIDVHRDALEYSPGNLVKPVCFIDGEKTAQVMIISGCDDGTMNMPNWAGNLKWAGALQSTMESDYPGLTRPVYFCYRKYNMDLTTGSLLVEIGGHGNTLAEAARAAEYVGKAMAKTLLATLAP